MIVRVGLDVGGSHIPSSKHLSPPKLDRFFAIYEELPIHQISIKRIICEKINAHPKI
jgi:hypothetical protein